MDVSPENPQNIGLTPWKSARDAPQGKSEDQDVYESLVWGTLPQWHWWVCLLPGIGGYLENLKEFIPGYRDF
jgi:hypothetical protein